MIMVEVQIPALGRRYDFELEETVQVKILLDEMIEVICQKEQLDHVPDKEGLGLYRQEGGVRLNGDGTLQQNGVCGGQRLILV